MEEYEETVNVSIHPKAFWMFLRKIDMKDYIERLNFDMLRSADNNDFESAISYQRIIKYNESKGSIKWNKDDTDRADKSLRNADLLDNFLRL